MSARRTQRYVEGLGLMRGFVAPKILTGDTLPHGRNRKAVLFTLPLMTERANLRANLVGEALGLDQVAAEEIRSLTLLF